MRYPFVIMDLNGTLVDTFDDLTAALNEVLAAHGRSALDAAHARQGSGEGLRQLLRAAFQATGPHLSDPEAGALLLEFRAAYERHLGTRAHLYSGVAATLQTLAQNGVKMAVLTNKPEAPSLKLIGQMGIAAWFDYLVAGDGEVARKPDPEGMDVLLGQLGARPDQALMVGSSRIDLETARNARVAIALVDHDPAAPVRGMGADYVLDHFGKLAALVLGQRPSGVFHI